MNYKPQFNTHKHHAKCRNIEFQFTYEQWVAWWGDDILNRGKKQGQLVMARIGDQGPYHPDNVVKKTCSENAREANVGKVFSDEHRKNIGLKSLGRNTGIPPSNKGIPWTQERREKYMKTLKLKEMNNV